MAFEPTIVQRAMARLERRREGRERKRWDLEQRLYPVSYTHLDVYKRQGLGDRTAPGL